jgi:exopolysaccharide/PEP-CTERM locus tyrosine autokinase
MRKIKSSLLERAAGAYDFDSHLRARGAPMYDVSAIGDVVDRDPAPIPPAVFPAPLPPRASGGVAIDRAMLENKGLLVPGAAIGALAEEFRQVKRQMLITARTVRSSDVEGAHDLARTILICSAKPDEGKTYCAVNLAISMAAERDTEVLLVDADFAKPDVMKRLGVQDSAGLLDALGDPRIDVESCVVRTDIPQLSLLPAGAKTNQDTELLASDRTRELIAHLLAADPRRILIFDSPPVLAASPASVLAAEVGQVLIVVRADSTGDGDLREAVAELDACEHIQLILNAVSFNPGGRRYGDYYAQGEAK